MTTITMRPYAGEVDLLPLVALFEACRAADPTEDVMTLETLRNEFSEPGFDPTRDVRFWEDADGTLVGFGLLWIPDKEPTDGYTWCKVHPAVGEAELLPQILDWLEGRMHEQGQIHNKQATLHPSAPSTQTSRIAVLEARGYTIARYFWRMARSLGEPLPVPQPPEGFTIRHLAGPDEVPAWVDAYNQSFIDHYDHHPLAVDVRRHWANSASYQPELDLVAVAPDATLVAFAYCSIDAAQNAQHGRREGWIEKLGTRRGFRSMGLGRAMLLTALQRLKAAGMETALLGVDAASPTGAQRLYESVGFEVVRTFHSYVKDV